MITMIAKALFYASLVSEEERSILEFFAEVSTDIYGIPYYDSTHPEAFFSYGFPSVRLHDQDGARPFVVDIAAVLRFGEATSSAPSDATFLPTKPITKPSIPGFPIRVPAPAPLLLGGFLSAHKGLRRA